jgi:hypothetical protein
VECLHLQQRRRMYDLGQAFGCDCKHTLAKTANVYLQSHMQMYKGSEAIVRIP